MKNRTISVKGSEIAILRKEREDYISLTDMVRGFEDGLVLIEKWLLNKNTIEFIGIWEQLHNPSFNSPEFEGIKNAAGLNRFTLSVKKWLEKTGAIGLISKSGRYGGTYAHKDIAFWVASESEARSLESNSALGALSRCASSRKTHFDRCIHGFPSWRGIDNGLMKYCTRNTNLRQKRVATFEAVIRPMEVNNE